MTNPNARLTPAKAREQLAALKAERLRCCYAGCSTRATRRLTRTAATWPLCEDHAPAELLASLELGGTFTVAAL